MRAGDSAVIVKCNVAGSAAARLSSLGIGAGVRVTVLSYSLFKGSVLISCKSARVGIRKSLARLIEVRKCE